MSSHVTAGMPALSSDLRNAITKIHEGRDRNRALLQDDIKREASLTKEDASFDVTDQAQQMGRPLSRSELERKLLLCNKNFIFETSIQDPTKAGVYVITPTGKRFLCGFINGISPEFSVIVPEEKTIPDPDGSPDWQKVRGMKSEIRGWRTVLAMLIKSRAITQAQAETHFETHKGRQSQNWQRRIS
jgi:hypothetical protein